MNLFLWNIQQRTLHFTGSAASFISNVHLYRNACSIQDPLSESVIITGGFHTPETVSLYNKTGWVKDFPSLNWGREKHGCGSYLGEQGETVFLVTGGKDWRDQYLDTTEILSPGKPWRQAHGQLPRPLASVAVTTLENVVYLFGKIQLTRP